MARVQVYTAKKKRWHQRRYQKRLSQGLCPICGGKRTGVWIICEVCREKHRAYSKTLTPEARMEVINRYRKRCRRQGICYGCGRYIGFGRYKRCEACREKDKIAHAERYEEMAVGGREE